MTADTLIDIPFDDAADVGDIRYRLAALDVGFSLLETRTPIAVSRSADPIRVSYDGRDGRRVMSGPQADVLRALRGRGYRFVVRD